MDKLNLGTPYVTVATVKRTISVSDYLDVKKLDRMLALGLITISGNYGKSYLNGGRPQLSEHLDRDCRYYTEVRTYFATLLILWDYVNVIPAAKRANLCEAREQSAIDHKFRRLQRDHDRRNFSKSRETPAVRRSRDRQLQDRRSEKDSRTAYFAGVTEQAMGRLLMGSDNVKRVEKLVENLETLTSKASPAIDAGVDLISLIHKGIESMVTTLKQTLGFMLWAVPVSLLLYYIYRRFGVTSAVAGLAIIGVARAILPKDLWTKLHTFFTPAEEQSNMNFMSHILCSTASFVFLRGKTSADVVDDLLRKLANLPRAVTGLEGFLEFMKKGVMQVVEFFAKRFHPNLAKRMEKLRDPVDVWIRKIDELELASVTNQSDPDQKALDELVDCCVQGAAYRDAFRHTPMEKFICEAFAKAKRLLSPHTGALSARNNFRVEPVSVFLYGGAGVGKTSILTRFATSALVMSGLCEAKDAKANLWQKGTSKYWNSYAGQLALGLDDFGQEKPYQGQEESEYMTLIRAKGCWSFPLAMADVESKGKTFFRSKLMVATTNVDKMKDQVGTILYSDSAVERRIDYPLRLEVHPDYLKEGGVPGELDYEKLQKEVARRAQLYRDGKLTLRSPCDVYPWYVWKVYKHDFFSVQTGEPVEYDLHDLLVEISKKLRDRSAMHKNAEADLDDFLAGLTPIKEQSGREIEEISTFLDGDFLDLDEISEMTLEQFAEQREKVEMSLRMHTMSKTLKFQDRWELFKLWINTQITSVAAVIHRNKWIILGVVAVAAAVGLLVAAVRGMWSFVKSFFSKKKDNDKGQRRQSNRLVTKPRPVVQLGSDNAVLRTFYSDTYKMFVEYVVGGEALCEIFGQVQFLNGGISVCPYHFITSLESLEKSKDVGTEVRVNMRNAINGDLEYGAAKAVTAAQILKLPRERVPGEDVVFMNWEPLNVRAHTAKEHHIIEEEHFKLLSMASRPARLSICDIDINGVLQSGTMPRFFQCEKLIAHKPMRLTNSSENARVWEYCLNTQEGDCGAPLTLTKQDGVGKYYLGFHIAGDGHNKGFSAVVTKEMYDRHTAKLGVKGRPVVKDTLMPACEQAGRPILEFEDTDRIPEAYNSGSFTVIGKVEKAVNVSSKSKIFPTVLHGVLGPAVDVPVALGPVRDGAHTIYPMENAIQANKTPVMVVDTELPIWQQAMHVAGKKFMEVTGPSRLNARVLTFEEACIGNPVLKLKAINRNSSAGYPYCLEYSSGKKHFFGRGDEYDLTGPAAQLLRSDVEKIIEKAKKGERSPVIYNDFLKDERRSPEKVANHMARLISSSPLDYTIAVRMYFGAILSAMFSNSIDSGLAPGACVYQDWGTLAKHLQSKGGAVFDGDFKRFDSTQQPDLLMLICDFINDWYTTQEITVGTCCPGGQICEDNLVRYVLFQDLIHSRHLGGLSSKHDIVYQWNKCLPSGHPLTTLVNSLFSLLMLSYSYIVLTGDRLGFWDHCFANSFGDDNIVNVDDETKDVFNQVTVAKVLWEDLGMVYTAGAKDGSEIPYKTLEECTFLKRSFHFDGKWLAPLELNSFMQTFYWAKNKLFVDQTIRSDLNNALEELSLHTQEVWDEHAPRLMQAARKFDPCFTPNAPLTLAAHRDVVCSRTDWY